MGMWLTAPQRFAINLWHHFIFDFSSGWPKGGRFKKVSFTIFFFNYFETKLIEQMRGRPLNGG